jgi:hypothetical protein
MKKLNKHINFLILILTLHVTSCAVSVKTPSSTFLSPESQGMAGNVGMSSGMSGGVEATLNIDNNLTTNPLDIERESLIGYGAAIGLADKLDVYGNIYVDSPSGIGLKYQFLDKDKFSASFAMDYGSTKEEVDADFFDLSGNTQTDLKSSARNHTLLIGYRASEKALYFAKIHYGSFEMSGTISSDDSNIDGKSFDYSGSTTTLGLGAIVNYNKKVYMHIEVDYLKADWDKTESNEIGTYAFALGYKW